MLYSSFWKERKNTEFDELIFACISEAVQIMSLSTEQKENIKTQDSTEAILKMAADNGLSFDRARIVDDEKLAEDIPVFWQMVKDSETKEEGGIKERVAEAVLELSGLTNFYNEVMEAETDERKATIEGDDPNLEQKAASVSTDQLLEDASAFNAAS